MRARNCGAFTVWSVRKRRGPRPPEHELLHAASRVVAGEKPTDVLSDCDAHDTHIAASTLTDAAQRLRDELALPRLGRPQHFSEEQERKLVDWCLDSAQLHLPQTKRSVLYAAMQMAIRLKRPFKTDNKMPSQHWWRNFRDRWPELRLASGNVLSRLQSGVSDPAVILSFFAAVEEYCKKYGISFDSVWNVDESGFGKVDRFGKVLVDRDERNPKVQSADHFNKHTTFLVAINGAGMFSTPTAIIEVSCSLQMVHSRLSAGPKRVRELSGWHLAWLIAGRVA